MNEHLSHQLSFYQAQPHLLLCTGHHQGRYAPPGLGDLMNLGCDLTEIGDLGEPLVRRAQARAAELWGAEHTAFLINGATVGLHALLLGQLKPGERVLLPRNVHQSVIAALILGRLCPVWLEPAWDQMWGIAHGITADQVESVLAQDPMIRAVLVVYPTYYGYCLPLAALVAVAHRHGVPVFVDSAHGSHLAFCDPLPPCAVAVGADGVVHSTHKTGGSMTQTALLHLQGQWVDPQHILNVLGLLQTTSPNYLLLSSLELTTNYLAQHGQDLWTQTYKLAQGLRLELGDLPGCQVLSLPSLDLTRITLGVPVDGFALEDFLIERQIHPELSGPDHLVFILTPAHTPELLAPLIPALREGLAHLRAQPPRTWPPPPAPNRVADLAQSFFGAKELVPLAKSIGRISAQTLSVYPPGIPLILPGELITSVHLEYLATVAPRLTGWQEPGHLAVIRDNKAMTALLP